MKGLIQRVSEASVTIGTETVGQIDRGILLLLGFEPQDGDEQSEKMLHKLLNYRIFPDAEGRMNRSVSDIDGGILVVSQFTLAADTRKGLRPGFSTAASPQAAESLYTAFLERLTQRHARVASGRFGADMQVALINDGPVTFLLEV